MKTRIILVGGFLGAGKTTLLWEAAKYLADKQKRVGLITNDQASELVDTSFLKKSGGVTSEVSGSCFCCNFNGFTDSINAMREENKVDIIIAEPVGSCTDLSATIVQPLKEKFNENLIVAPLTALVDPDRICDIMEERKSGLHSSAEYIVKKQMEEADYIVINKIDVLNQDELENLKRKIKERFPYAKVFTISAQTGDGMEEWLDEVISSNQSGLHLPEVDYDIYAEGEAVLGWLNTTIHLSGQEIDWKEFGKKYLAALSDTFNDKKATVGHVKLMIDGKDNYVIGNLTGKKETLNLRGESSKDLKVTLTLNARVQMSPDQLEEIVRKELELSCSDRIQYEVQVLKCLQPGRPNPTYHYNKIVK